MGYTVKQLRVGKNLNQTEFAKLISMNPDTYAKKEQGRRNWLAKEIIRIAEVCNIKVEDIIIWFIFLLIQCIHNEQEENYESIADI